MSCAAATGGGDDGGGVGGVAVCCCIGISIGDNGVSAVRFVEMSVMFCVAGTAGGVCGGVVLGCVSAGGWGVVWGAAGCVNTCGVGCIGWAFSGVGAGECVGSIGDVVTGAIGVICLSLLILSVFIGFLH